LCKRQHRESKKEEDLCEDEERPKFLLQAKPVATLKSEEKKGETCVRMSNENKKKRVKNTNSVGAETQTGDHIRLCSNISLYRENGNGKYENAE
jgi:hypothetical protein